MSMKQKEGHPSQLLNDLTDSQQHQYDPSRYLTILRVLPLLFSEAYLIAVIPVE